MKTIYTAEVVSSGDGRNGSVRSSDGLLELGLSAPKEMGGSGEGSNPEQLFAAGYAACFHSAMRLAARQRNIVLRDDRVTARVHLNKDETGYSVSAGLTLQLPHVDRETAHWLAGAAHERCPYSKAVRGNIAVEIAVDG